MAEQEASTVTYSTVRTWRCPDCQELQLPHHCGENEHAACAERLRVAEQFAQDMASKADQAILSHDAAVERWGGERKRAEAAEKERDVWFARTITQTEQKVAAERHLADCLEREQARPLLIKAYQERAEAAERQVEACEQNNIKNVGEWQLSERRLAAALEAGE